MPTEREWKKQRERAYIAEPEQKAAIYFHGGTEDLVVSPSYAGAAGEFAWVIPVPARPKVEILNGALFHQLAELIAPPPAPRAAGGAMKAGAPAATRAVQVLEEKVVGAYQVAVLAATDSGALSRWLARHRFHLPEGAPEPMRFYVRKGWTFVASRIKNSRAAAGLHSGTLAPLRLTFQSRQPVYPMRLSRANRSNFRVLIYTLVTPEELPKGRPQLVALTRPSGAVGAPRYVTEYDPKPHRYPTLEKLAARRLAVFFQDTRVDAARCDADYTWSLVPRTARASNVRTGVASRR